MKRMKTLAIVLSAILLSSACATRTQFLCPVLPEPARPSVPSLPSGELACVSDEAAARLNERELRLVEYAEDMEVIISTHNENCRRWND